MSPKPQYPRYAVEQELIEIVLKTSKPQFVYIRGRRRVGKSWLLKKITESNKSCAKCTIYFSGAKDSSADETKTQFINIVSTFFSTSVLKEINKDYLDWTRLFSELVKIIKSSRKKITLIFDEIQWIAKTGSGFIGAVKAAWIDIERNNLANIIICGSSNKFFNDQVGGEEKILRGLQTRAALVVTPVPLADVKKYFFPKWQPHEVAILYMLIGGIPYYLQQIDADLGFVNAINSALFSAETIFLDEVDEILGLDFNRLGLKNIKKILTVLAGYGGSQAKVRKNFKLTASTISPLFDKLQSYSIIELLNDFRFLNKLILQGKESYFFINDFYLNSYFAIFEKLHIDIKKNIHSRNNIFAHRILANDKYYIEGFTGKAFEHLVRYCLRSYDLHSQLYKKLLLKDFNFELCSLESKNMQIDLIVVGKTDRIVRIIECKWAKNFDSKWITQLKDKELKLEKGYSRIDVILHACESRISAKLLKQAKDAGTVLLSLQDLFE